MEKTSALLISMLYGKLIIITPEEKVFTGVIKTSCDMKLRDQVLRTATGEELIVGVRSKDRDQISIVVENLALFDICSLKPGVIRRVIGINPNNRKVNHWRLAFATDAVDGRNPLM